MRLQRRCSKTFLCGYKAFFVNSCVRTYLLFVYYKSCIVLCVCESSRSMISKSRKGKQGFDHTALKSSQAPDAMCSISSFSQQHNPSSKGNDAQYLSE